MTRQELNILFKIKVNAINKLLANQRSLFNWKEKFDNENNLNKTVNIFLNILNLYVL